MPVSDKAKQSYKPTIGIETHVQLKTKTKLFSAVGNDARNAPPNSLISHIDAGMPGALPVLNEVALELAARAAFALNTKPQKFSKFDRKHYFYPDLPKGYQITQYENPVITGGFVEIEMNGQKKKINITRVHLEEDAGKNIHPEGADYSLVDLNRAGTPLLEIVSEPEINSAQEAKAYARELYLLMKYADVSDVDLYHGNMRFDVNISVSKHSDKLGKRAEVKNLNSFRSVESAVAYEIERQIELCEKGQDIIQETRGWDEAKQKTTSQRGKEEAHDYRYMPEPDIPPIELDEKWIAKVEEQMPDSLQQMRSKLKKLDIEPKVIEDILDNSGVYKKIAEAMKATERNEVVRRIAFDSLKNPLSLQIPITDHLKIAEAVVDGDLSSSAGMKVIEETQTDKQHDIDELIGKNSQLSDESEIEKIVQQVIEQNPKAVADLKKGEMKAIGFLVGQVMVKSQGKANPSLAQKIIKNLLDL